MDPTLPASLCEPADAGLYARSFVDVYDKWYRELHDVDAVRSAVRQHVEAGGLVLELGSGSGRLASALTADFTVIALDVAVDMLAQDTSPSLCLQADMAALPVVRGVVDACLIAYNTLFNAASLTAQQRCLVDVAAALRPGGVLLVETFVAPAPSGDQPFAMSIVDHHTDPDQRLAIATWHHRALPERISGAHIELGPGGTRSRPWQLVYRSPAELDAVAADAGLDLVSRDSDWRGSDFHDADDEQPSVRQVSVYRRIASARAA